MPEKPNNLDNDQQYMMRALELAAFGRGKVSPNPMVGCVIVHNDAIIGEGWHQQYGASHAEVNAIDSVKDKSVLQNATVYVNLEPCAHHGKTPPCAALLAEHRVQRIVVANIDPNPRVSGQGIQMLNNAGIEVMQGVLENKAQLLNQRFFTFYKMHRPWIMLKWAETADGFLARKNYDSKWISNKHARTLVHKWRSEEDAIMVGKNTAKYDNPRLNTRMWVGKNPIRIVLDTELKLSNDLNIFDEQQPTLVINNKMNESISNLEYVKVDDQQSLDCVLKKLYERNIQSLIVEGGSKLLTSFIHQGLWDEARIFKSTQTFGEGVAAPTLTHAQHMYSENIAGDQLMIFKNNSYG